VEPWSTPATGARFAQPGQRRATGSGIQVAHYSADATPRRKQLIQTGESKGFTTQMKKSTVLAPAAVIATETMCPDAIPAVQQQITRADSQLA
jgi:hypothetical protein